MSINILSKDWIVWESVNTKRKKARKNSINSILFSPLLRLYLTLSICGLLLISSSSSYLASTKFDNIFYFAQKQGLFMIISILLGYIIIKVPVVFWERVGPGLLLLGTIALVLVFLLNQHPINGSYRWIRIGPINFQPSEFVKLAVIIYLGGYLVRHMESIKKNLSAFIRPIVLVSMVSSLILIEPDLGGTLIVLMITLTMLFIGGVNIFHFIVFTAGVIASSAIATYFSPYRLTRITSLNENIFNSVETYDNNYQILQSLVAFSQGQFSGLGFGASRQKLLYLSEAHTDFIFSILAEELGIIGMVFLIILFFLLIKHILKIAKQASICRHLFAAYFSYGFATLIALHAFIHIAVTMRLIPTTGMPLPFISYGGSSFLAFSIGVAIILRIEYELCPQPKPTKTIKRSR